MTKAEALNKYPSLEYMRAMDLVVLYNDAVKLGDKDFATAIDAIIKQTMAPQQKEKDHG